MDCKLPAVLPTIAKRRLQCAILSRCALYRDRCFIRRGHIMHKVSLGLLTRIIYPVKKILWIKSLICEVFGRAMMAAALTHRHSPAMQLCRYRRDPAPVISLKWHVPKTISERGTAISGLIKDYILQRVCAILFRLLECAVPASRRESYIRQTALICPRRKAACNGNNGNNTEDL